MRSTVFKHFIYHSQHLVHKLNSYILVVYLCISKSLSKIDQIFQVFFNSLKEIKGNNVLQYNNDLFIMNTDKVTPNYSHLCQYSGMFMKRIQEQKWPMADLDQVWVSTKDSDFLNSLVHSCEMLQPPPNHMHPLSHPRHNLKQFLMANDYSHQNSIVKAGDSAMNGTLSTPIHLPSSTMGEPVLWLHSFHASTRQLSTTNFQPHLKVTATIKPKDINK